MQNLSTKKIFVILFVILPAISQLRAEDAPQAPIAGKEANAPVSDSQTNPGNAEKSRRSKSRASKRKERSREHKEHRREQRRNRKQGLN